MTENRKQTSVIILCAGCLAVLFAAGGTAAFLTFSDRTENLITVGQNTTRIVEEFPDPTPVPIEENPEYRKKVTAVNAAEGKNGSQVECYVRMAVGYSHSDISRGVILNGLDTENWVLAEDGYYYFIKPLKEGESTTPLFTSFRIDSSKVNTEYLELIPEFEIQIYEESVQAEGFADYKQAWAAYQVSV